MSKKTQRCNKQVFFVIELIYNILWVKIPWNLLNVGIGSHSPGIYQDVLSLPIVLPFYISRVYCQVFS